MPDRCVMLVPNNRTTGGDAELPVWSPAIDAKLKRFKAENCVTSDDDVIVLK